MVIAASIGAQILAEQLRIPAIVPLLIVGILIGPEALALVTPNALGDGLRVLIPLLVAIIVFEGGMALDLNQLRQVSPVIRNLITIGALVTMLLATLFTRLFVGIDWSLALLFGALVSVTGPTVINPLLRHAAVTQRLKTILMAEGVLVDAVGVVLSVICCAGRPLRDIRLDDDVLIAFIRRGERLFMPHGATTLALGNQVTLIGTTADVAAAGILFERST